MFKTKEWFIGVLTLAKQMKVQMGNFDNADDISLWVKYQTDSMKEKKPPKTYTTI
jgi:hypothetical protein